MEIVYLSADLLLIAEFIAYGASNSNYWLLFFGLEANYCFNYNILLTPLSMMHFKAENLSLRLLGRNI